MLNNFVFDYANPRLYYHSGVHLLQWIKQELELVVNALVRSPMGRPKKGIERMPVRVDVEAIAQCRMACLGTGEALVDYISRVLMEQATKDANIAAERQLGKAGRTKGDES